MADIKEPQLRTGEVGVSSKQEIDQRSEADNFQGFEVESSQSAETFNSPVSNTNQNVVETTTVVKPETVRTPIMPTDVVEGNIEDGSTWNQAIANKQAGGQPQ